MADVTQILSAIEQGDPSAAEPDDAEGVVGRAVLHARLGDRGAALRDAREALLLSREAMIVYQAGDTYALTSRQRPEDAGQAPTYLHEALRNGFGADVLDHDPDLRPLHRLEGFRDLHEFAAKIRKSPQPGQRRGSSPPG